MMACRGLRMSWPTMAAVSPMAARRSFSLSWVSIFLRSVMSV